MSRIDDVTLACLQPFAINSAKGRDEQQSLSLDHQHEQSLTSEERLSAAPPRIYREMRITGKIRTRLHKEWLSAEFDGRDVTGCAGSERYFAWTTARGERRDECRFAAGRSLDSAEKTALHL